MRKFKVRVERSDTQFWEVEARSEKEALDNYVSGNLCQTNTHGDYVSMVGEITERKSE
jgi:predicted HicB family RNase H-like nuclease